MNIAYVLPVHNEQNNIIQCLNSLKDQSVEGKIYLGFDKPDDHTEKIFDLSRIEVDYVYRTKERSGSAYLRNKLTKKAILDGADIIAVCDCDIYYKDRGKAIIEFFEEFTDKSVFSSALHCRKSENPFEVWEQGAYEWDFKSKCPISHPTVAYRKEVWKKHNYFENSKETDLYEFFLLEAHKNGFEFGGCQNPLVLKIEGNSDRSKSEAWKLKKKMYEKYGVYL